MKMLVKNIISRAVISFIAISFLVACSANPNSFPQIASPPPFDFVDGEELRSNMHQLAFELQQLDMSLASESDGRANFQQEVVDSIRNIESIAGFVQSGDLRTRHPFLLDDMDRFLVDVRKAREDASRRNPRYYMAGRISGGCINCHRESN